MSQIIATTLSNGSVSVPTATVVNGSAKAWISFNGTGTVAIEDSFNTASLVDNGTGNYTQNYSSSMANAVYQVGGMNHAGGTAYTSFATTRAASSWTSTPGRTDTFVGIDTNQNQHSIHGDLA